MKVEISSPSWAAHSCAYTDTLERVFPLMSNWNYPCSTLQPLPLILLVCTPEKNLTPSYFQANLREQRTAIQPHSGLSSLNNTNPVPWASSDLFPPTAMVVAITGLASVCHLYWDPTVSTEFQMQCCDHWVDVIYFNLNLFRKLNSYVLSRHNTKILFQRNLETANRKYNLLNMKHMSYS